MAQSTWPGDGSSRTIFRSLRKHHFTTVPNSLARDSSLSFKARGILLLVLSNCDEWVVHQSWLEEQGLEGREAIRSGMKELVAAGYARYEEVREGGMFVAGRWTFMDEPDLPDDGKPSVGIPSVGKPSLKKEHLTESHKKKNRGAEGEKSVPQQLLPKPHPDSARSLPAPTDAGLADADRFSAMLPSDVRRPLGWRESVARVFDALAEDGRDEVEMLEVCRYAFSSSFWAAKVLNPANLLKVKNGVQLYDEIKVAMIAARRPAAQLSGCPRL